MASLVTLAAMRPVAPPQAGACHLSDLAPRDLVDLKVRLHRVLLSQLDLTSVAALEADGRRDELRAFLRSALSRVMSDEGISFESSASVAEFADGVLDEMLGFSQLEPYLKDPTVTEIMVNGPHQVYVERSGRLEATDTVFLNDAQVMRVIDRIVAPIGRRVDESSPMVDARLPDGSRVSAVIPPLSLHGPVLTVRKFSRRSLSIADLVELNALTADVAQVLAACVRRRDNILVSGGTGSGKTTLLNALSSFIPADERVVTIEDAAELQLNQTHLVSLEARPANAEGRGSVSIRDLVRNALRMRPDRIIVGEVRGPEALDMLQAMNTGHSGSMTTCHANSPKDSLLRVETMVLMAGMDLPLPAVRAQIASALDVIVQQTRMGDGSRRVTRVCQVVATDGGDPTVRDLFRLRGLSSDGSPLYERPAEYEPRERDGMIGTA